MREIKFKAWDKTNKKMIDLQKITPLALSDSMNTQLSLQGMGGLFIPFKKDLNLMQYTGLKDKNGKEVYEGDIIRGNLIKYSPLATMGEIIFDEYWCSFANKNKAGETLLREIDRIEVIGNVYENSEILGKE